MTDSQAASGPAPLRLPAILQNPKDRSARQVEAYNAQQREKAAARRDTRAPEVSAYNGRGKRFVRRKDNAAFTSNPHVVQPRRSDFAPPVPLQQHILEPTFPLGAVPRSAEAPSARPPTKNPFSSDSRSGTFSTSLKGTRALLRKGGRRAEEMVNLVEGRLRKWLDGEGWNLGHETEEPEWTVVDPTLVNVELEGTDGAGPSSPPSSRRMPHQHRLRDHLPPLPVAGKQVPAILELSRSPAHLSWAVVDGFDRLVIHLVVRYYELVSWSEDHITANGQTIRMTHIIMPSMAQPKIPRSSFALATPETSDLSAPSSSDRDTSTDGETEIGTDTDSDAGTEVGYSLEGEGDISIATVTPELIEGVAQIDINELHRVSSNSSSMYASSEGGSDFGMADSLVIPPPPANGWTSVTYSDAESDFDRVSLPGRNVSTINALGRMGPRGWEERPSFFEYLYGS